VRKNLKFEEGISKVTVRSFSVCFQLEVRPVVFLKKDETILEVLKNGDKRLLNRCSATCT
jgi:hypothetical protein